MNESIIFITGCTRGLGLAMVEGFIQLGHTICGCGRNESAVAQLQEKQGSPHFFKPVDVSDDNAVKAFAEEAIERVGVPDILINNAAIINDNENLWDIDAKTFSDLIDVNIKGTANTIRHLVPAMIARGSGIIVNFSSAWGRSTSPQVAPYCASKWAIEGLTQALAQELPAGMAAVPLAPGTIDTDMLRTCFGEEASGYQDPQTWATHAVPRILQISAQDNGKSLSV